MLSDKTRKLGIMKDSRHYNKTSYATGTDERIHS